MLAQRFLALSLTLSQSDACSQVLSEFGRKYLSVCQGFAESNRRRIMLSWGLLAPDFSEGVVRMRSNQYRIFGVLPPESDDHCIALHSR